MNVIEESANVIKERGDDYGNPKMMYKQISGLWSVWLGVCVTPQDVAHMMIQMKQVRDRVAGGHRDSKVDICGYAAVLEMLDESS